MVIINSNSIALKGKTALALRIEPLDNLRHKKKVKKKKFEKGKREKKNFYL
jgi:hypothetical protein